MRYECIGCGRTFDPHKKLYTCPECGSLLEIELDLEAVKEKIDPDVFESEEPTTWKYRPFMPIFDDSKIVSLREGGTPLYRCERLAEEIGVQELYVKYEGTNPTGSFKDRGMTVGVTKALEFGLNTVACASTGNTSASLSAYAAKAGLKCVVLLPKAKVALGKLAQAIIHGAQVIAIDGNFDRALEIVRRICDERENVYLLNSVNPFRSQGQKSIGFEIADQLDFVSPDRVVLPMGNCANIWSIYKGFFEFKETSIVESIPKMTGVQAEGAMPVVDAIKRGLEEFEPVEDPETIATAIRIGNPVNGPKALKAIRESRGTAESVTDDEIVRAQKMLARHEGLGVEPASASSIAGLIRLVEDDRIYRDERIVCVVTGHILKDPQEAIEVSEPPIEVPADYEEVIKRLGS
ncbi:threonine synthase [candidate division MSBL1 archaeon SCGC-AAA261D19]|uniref:Threonine synthase n=1 Tax=candidate division MSBL1 archaeon SCGC-AAA261D19 TaxID=1698273 RepID=A0A133V876_9EURY|nr:threonine synthase [candidate division MSBL1 archaeon SCGC-AAA261D19]